ncbi:MAG: hypothetical protein RLZZ618_130 [Pseudomonadota bacterium]|jgi:predicted negative regulator of RcsB-dependent stress response
MAKNLDLEEQEQLDQLKAFWARYGSLILLTVALALGTFAGWSFYKNWKSGQEAKAGALFDDLETAVKAGDVDKTTRVFSDMRDHFPRTAYAEQSALLAGKLQADKGKAEAAVATLTWAAEHASDTEYRTMARLRLAGIALDQKKYDDALKLLAAADAQEFVGLVADRRGDVLLAQGKKDEAKVAYLQAWKALDPSVEYRVITESKLTALGASPSEEPAKAAP